MTQNMQNKSRKWFTVSGRSMTDRHADRQTKFTLRWLDRGSLTLAPITSLGHPASHDW